MTHSFTPSRRRFLKALGSTALALPSLALPGFVTAAGANPRGGNILVLVELAGGNDGLNTLIHRRDPAYRALRPTLAIPERYALGLDRDTALHPAMGAMAGLWEDGDLQIVEGVGYPNPNRSHFRSIEIWNSGQGADGRTRDGWVSAAFTEGAGAEDADGLVLGGDFGPLAGEGRFAAIRDPELFADNHGHLPQAGHATRPGGARASLDHILSAYDSAQVTGEAILRRLERSPARPFPFPDSEIGRQLENAARLLEAGLDVSVLKVVQDGYDTHDGQADAHWGLLEDLSDALGAFADALRQIGIWEKVSVVTYSEFGRTAAENASAGTDHGTAAPLFIAGGAVRGGLGGARPSLTELVDGEMVHSTDYREVYNALLSDLWGIDPVFEAQTERDLRILDL
ncbi:MAG: DUF1501 domain-containing protein [Pseudomonadota bacterium]